MKNYWIVALIALSLAGCTKENNDVTAPGIILASPTSNQHYTEGSVLEITGTVSENHSIREVTITITEQGAANALVTRSYEPEEKEKHEFYESYVLYSLSGAHLKVEVTAKDANGNKTIASADVFVD